jgi:hypothetical protein
MIHVYAVTDGAGGNVEVAGLAGARVELVAVGDLRVAVSRHGSSTLPPSTDTILEHAQVCDALHQAGGAMLPVRFGARYVDAAALRQSVTERARAFAAALDHVRGRVEIGVRVADVHAAAAPEVIPAPAGEFSSGSAYLRRRGIEEQQRTASKAAAQAIADDIHAHLGTCAVDATLKVQATPGLVLSAAYLVPADDVEDFAAKAALLSRDRQDIQLLCTGPWPPYHFAGEGALA